MINLMNWAMAALAFATVSVHGAAAPATAGLLNGRAEPLPTVVYRGSVSIPETIKERGGFIPRPRDDEPISNTTFGLRNHHIGKTRTVLPARISQEEEFVALGGVRYDQIEAWAPASDGELNFTANPDFASKKYEGLSASPGQPQLAGDQANLAKYNEKTLEEYAIEFMEKNGGPVGFDGMFPLNVLKTDAPAKPTDPNP
ncbi:hypothetical protein MY4038_008788 [Beauveria bassiana]